MEAKSNATGAAVVQEEALWLYKSCRAIERQLVLRPQVWKFRCLLREELISRSPALKYQLGGRREFRQSRREINKGLGLSRKASRKLHWKSDSTAFKRLPRFKHSPIDPEREFRCFILMPGRLHEPIVGRLVSMPFRRGVVHEAVSYRWSNHPAREWIQINDSRYAVSHEVAIMLRHLRYWTIDRILWIDTICINQGDEAEKTEQVHRMEWIFSNAFRTTIWLGMHDSTTSSAVELMSDLYQVFKYKTENTSSENGDIDLFTLPGMPAADDPRWPALDNFLHKDWFTRTWVIQEMSLAREPHVVCGLYGFDWAALERIIDMLRLVRSYPLEIRTDPVWKMVDYHLTYRYLHISSLLGILVLNWASETTVAKDKVFGIIGLASDRDEIKGLVKYSDKVETIFTKIASHYIRKGNLEVLNLANDPSLRNIRSMPSWVPDWSSSTVGGGILSRWRPLHTFNPNDRLDKPAKLPRVVDSDTTLILPGLILDRVKLCSRATSTYNRALRGAHGARARLFFKQWQSLADTLRVYPTGESIADVFERTLSMTLPDTPSQNPELRPKYDIPKIEETADILKRTLFTTEAGFLGLGPFFTRPGDYIARFDSSPLPFILRKFNRGYRLVGDAYIHGMMFFGDHSAVEYVDIYIF